MLILSLCVLLAVTPASTVLAQTTNMQTVAVAASSTSKTAKSSFYVLKTTGILKVFNYYAKDNFKVTYNPKTGKISKVTTSYSSKTPLNIPLFEREKVTRKKISAKKWRFISYWYINVKLIPDSLASIVESKVPLIYSLANIGRVCRIRNIYYVTGDGKVTKSTPKYQLVVPEGLESAAKTLLKIFWHK